MAMARHRWTALNTAQAHAIRPRHSDADGSRWISARAHAIRPYAGLRRGRMRYALTQGFGEGACDTPLRAPAQLLHAAQYPHHTAIFQPLDHLLQLADMLVLFFNHFI